MAQVIFYFWNCIMVSAEGVLLSTPVTGQSALHCLRPFPPLPHYISDPLLFSFFRPARFSSLRPMSAAASPEITRRAGNTRLFTSTFQVARRHALPPRIFAYALEAAPLHW